MTQTSVSHVFMSYSRRDEAAMQHIALFLRNQGINVWVDNEKLVPGTPIWEVEIEKAIKNASAIIVILSPDSKNSEWVRREISLADQYRTRIFPVLVRGDEDSSITIRLITRQYVDVRQNEEIGLSSLSAEILRFLEELEAQEKRAKEDVERQAHEKAERVAAEKAAREKTRREATEKAAKEKVERERIEKVEREKKEREQLEREKKVRKEKEEEAGELHYRGMLAHKQGKFDEAERLFQQSLNIAIDLKDDQGKASILNQLAILTQDRQAKEKVEREAAEKQATEKATREKAEKEAGELHYRGMLAHKQGNFDEAELLFQQSLKIAVDLKDEQAKANILHQLAILTQDRLDRKKAEQEAAEKTVREKAEREAAEKAAKVKAEREATERAAHEKTKREAEERVAREKAEREAAIKVAREKVEHEAAKKNTIEIKDWSGRMVVGGTLGLLFIVPMYVLTSGYFGFDVFLLVVICGLVGIITYPHKLSMVFLILGFFIAGFIFDPQLDYLDDFVMAGVMFGFFIGALLSRILHWVKVLK